MEERVFVKRYEKEPIPRPLPKGKGSVFKGIGFSLFPRAGPCAAGCNLCLWLVGQIEGED
ncbi:hypothetical protein GCM10023184_35790 [Flaviaesturariibacter amylovorans]|uniref:Radical SAM protein n=1 Tax=Flaviaesturariibacter amylovorans TaxID=1084520 RepID=A0ABP8HGC9_9BACT